jgi:hypothetical protein
LVHIDGLPRDSAYVRAVLGDRAYWDQQSELLASVVDEVRELTYYTLAINSSESVARPERFPRPGQTREEPVPEPGVSLAAFANFLEE